MNIKKNTIVSMLALSIMLAGCSGEEPAATEPVEESVVPVQVADVEKGVIDERASLTGVLAPDEMVQVSPKVGGKISEIAVSLGQMVKQGDILFKLDTTDLQNSVNQAQAAYNLAKASLEQSKSGSDQAIQTAENSVTQSKNAIVQQEQALKDADVNAKRVRSLFEAGAASKAELDQVETILLNAKVAYENAKTTLANAEQNLSIAKAKNGVKVSTAAVEQARVALENAQNQLAEATVKAPISGIVSVVPGTIGQMVSSQVPVVSIARVDPLTVNVNLSEKEITTVDVGSNVSVEIPSMEQTLDAKVTAVSPVMDDMLKAYPIEISIPNPDLKLKADMVVNVRFIAEDGQTMTIIPRNALVEEQNKTFVYKVVGENAEKVEIQTGKVTSKEVEVIEGVTPGETIVVTGHSLLYEGAKIKIQE